MAKRLRSPLAKHWCWTLNNPNDDDEMVNNELCEYQIFAMEVGEEGTPHIQGYLCLKTKKRLSGMKKLLPRAHLEVMKGTPKQAADYCKKDGSFVEFGTLPKTAGQVLKTKWDKAYKAAKDGKIEEIPKDMLIRYYHAFKRIRQDNPQKLNDLPETCGVWYYGPTGAGKSRLAREKYPNFYDKPLNKWWDGYKGEPYVILDDVCTNQGDWLGPFLKRWTDHYPFPAEQKGTTIQIRPLNIIITSQYSLECVFASEPLLVDALKRRFTCIQVPVNLYKK